MSRTIVFLLCAAWLLPAAAKIDSVTVFPDRATVTRIVSVDIDADSGQLVQDDLPAGLSRDSLRISASGPDGLRLGAYRLETVRGSERASDRARQIERQLKSLRHDRDELIDLQRARGIELSLITSMAEGAGQGDDKMALKDIGQALETLGKSAEKTLASQRELRIREDRISEEIHRLEQQLADLQQDERSTLALKLDWQGKKRGRAEFTIEYTVAQAAWRPVYEWRLDTAGNALEITQFAEVRQRSGEDWHDAELKLSLARPSAGGALPKPQPWWVNVVDPEADKRAVEEVRMYSQARTAAPMEDSAGADWDSAAVTGTEYTRAWQVTGRTSVAADNQPRRLRLDQAQFDVEISARTVPARQAAAWLYASGKWNGEQALPPGSATLYQDDTLVGNIHFEGAAPGQELASSFGQDNLIRVEYDLVKDDRASRGLIRKSSRLTRQHKLRITNGHSRAMDITVIDVQPTSRDERIEVALADGTPEPDQSNVDDQPGVLAWNRTIKAGKTLDMTLGYQLTTPEDLPGITGW